MLDKYLSKNVEKSSRKDKKQAAKSEGNKNYDDTLREKIGPGFATKAVENDITYGSTIQQTKDAVLDGSLTKLLKYAKDTITDGSLTKLLKYAIPDASTIERLKSFLPDGLTTEQVKGFILLAMAASAQRIGGVEVPRPTSSALDLWNNNPAYDGNASLPVCPIGSERLTEYRNAPFIVDQKHIQELNQKLANPPFFFEGPKVAQGTSDEKTSQSAMESPSHQLEQSESKQLAPKDSQDVPSSKEIEDITKLVEKYQSYCGKLRFSKAFIEAVKDQTNMKYPFSTWYDQHPRRMETSKALSCSNPKSELLRRLLNDKTYKDIVASALQTFEDREYGLNHRYGPLYKKVYDHGYHAGNRDGWEEGYDKGFYDHSCFYGNGYQKGEHDEHKREYKDGEHGEHKSRWKEELTEKILKEVIDVGFTSLKLIFACQLILRLERNLRRIAQENNNARAIGRREETDLNSLMDRIAHDEKYQEAVDERLKDVRERQQEVWKKELNILDGIQREFGEDLPTSVRLNILLENKIQGAIKGHIREKKLFPNQQHETPLSETLQRCFVEILENLPSPELQQDDIAVAFLDRLREKVKSNELIEDVFLKTSNLLKK